MRVEVRRSRADGMWRAEIINDGNNESISITEGYVNKAHAVSIAHDLAPDGARVVVHD